LGLDKAPFLLYTCPHYYSAMRGEIDMSQRMIERLEKEHRDMDEAIKILEMSPRPYYDDIAQMKKKKLVIKEQIAKLKGN
jgi:hypothetical protein